MPDQNHIISHRKILTRLLPLAGVVIVFIAVALWISYKNGSTTSSPACALGSCPTELYKTDSGKTFTYTLTSRFSVFLSGSDNPKENLHCIPEGVLGPISNIPPAPPGLYVVRFEGTSVGTCTLSDNNFHATIVITNLSS